LYGRAPSLSKALVAQGIAFVAGRAIRNSHHLASPQMPCRCCSNNTYCPSRYPDYKTELCSRF